MKRLIFFIIAILWSPFECLWFIFNSKPTKIANYIYSKIS